MKHGLLHGFRHYADFSGRDSRRVFWNFIIATHLVFILLLLPGIAALLAFWRTLLEDEFIVQTLAYALMGDMQCLFEAEVLAAVQDVASEFWGDPWGDHPAACLFSLLAGLWALAIIVPSLSATARRLRDAGYSPWWAAVFPLSAVCPLMLGVVLSVVGLVLCCLPGAPENQV